MANTPRIGYRNLAESATSVAASNEATGFEKENAYDWLTYDFWKPGVIDFQWIEWTFATAQTPDYFACIAHNLGQTGASLEFQRWIEGTSYENAFSTLSPAGSEIIFKTFTLTSSTKWRILLSNCTVDTALGVVAFGSVLTLPQGMRVGFTPPTLNRQHKILNSISVGGAFLGRSVQSRGHRLQIATGVLTPAWVRSDWEPFLDHAEEKPFFFSWDHDNYPAEAAFAWTRRGIDRPTYSTPNYMRIALDCDALVE